MNQNSWIWRQIPYYLLYFFFLFSEVEALLAAFLDEQHMTWWHFLFFYFSKLIWDFLLSRDFNNKDFEDIHFHIIYHSYNTVLFTKVSGKTSSSLIFEHNIYKACLPGIFWKVEEGKQGSIYKPQGAGNIRTVPGRGQMCVLAEADCCCVTGGAWSYFWLCVVINVSIALAASCDVVDLSTCDQMRDLQLSLCSNGADMIRMLSGETADSKARLFTPFGIRYRRLNCLVETPAPSLCASQRGKHSFRWWWWFIIFTL